MPTIKLLPRISGQLNNCGVNAGIPELLAKFSEFAAGEVSNEQKQVIPENYQQLKDSFETYYNLQNLTWKKLIDLLTGSVNNNSLAQQLILGPVLREFMHQKAPNQGYNTFAGARYKYLGALELNTNLYNLLGISLISHEKHKLSNGTEIDVTENNSIAPQNLASAIHIYNKGAGHWERYPAAEIAQAVDGRITLQQDCPDIHGVHQNFTDGFTSAGLDMLKATVASLHTNVAAQASQQAQSAQALSVPVVLSPTENVVKETPKWVKSAMALYHTRHSQSANIGSLPNPNEIESKLTKLYEATLNLNLDTDSKDFSDKAVAKRLQKEELSHFRP